MGFMIYDVLFLVLFVIFVAIFLYKKKKGLTKEGLLFLYRTPWGIKIINHIGRKYKKSLNILGYISITIGYFLMVAIFYFVFKITWTYLFNLRLVRTIKVPPIMPIIPYINKIVPGLPNFYFIYWIIIIAVIAITHELAHGIFAAYNKIKIKNTGFGFFPFFFPVFLAAFVELDEKKMQKKKPLTQMTILSAGAFANVLTAIFFLIIMWGFFSLAFTPAGIIFNSYPYSAVSIEKISSVNGMLINNATYEKIINLTKEKGLNNFSIGNESFLATKQYLKLQKNGNYLVLYNDAPAIRAGLKGAITKIDNSKINSLKTLQNTLRNKTPGDKITIETIIDGKQQIYNITLTENPNNKSQAWLGIGFIEYKKSLIGKFASWLTSFKKENIYYKPKLDGICIFIYNLLWWVILISISVALINMLPVGLFDGGRFFYLTILLLTHNKKKARKAFSFSTYFFLFILAIIMIAWAAAFLR